MSNYTLVQCLSAIRKLIKTHPQNFIYTCLVLFSSFFFYTTTAQTVRSAAGPDVAAITTARNQFRADLGGGTVAGAAGSFGGVRREINWDGVPDARSAPNNLPANFFNVNSPRGVVFSTPGTGFQVSANAGVAAVDFGNINASYPGLFAPFSPQRLFTALGSNITDINFFVPGTTTPALTRGFGAIFTDVDVTGSTKIDYFDRNNALLGSFNIPAVPGNETFSFLGVSFPAPVIARVRITAGNAPLGPNELLPAADLVVMDDFLYGEPVAASMVWYRDADHDGFGNPNDVVVAAIQPRGFVSNNLDCDDTKITYQDNDGDGFGNTTKVPCGGVTNRQDCNDADPTVQTPFTYFRDADGDGYGDAAGRITACSSTPPTGYVRNFRDCNDNDATAYAEFTFYRDADGDGVGDTNNPITLCHSETPPTGYVRTRGDCDDNNAAIQYPRTYFRDADGDGFGDRNGRTLICSLTAPAGYVTNYSDCNDNQVTYRDADGDGFGSNVKVACGGVANHDDCDDHNPAVHACVVTTCTTPSFAPAVTYPSGGSFLHAITTGDFNGDGKTDVAVANENSNTVGILLNNGNGSFAPAASYSSGGNSPTSVTTADFNSDGKADLAVANFSSGTVGILLNNGNGSFAPAMTYPSGSSFPVSVTTADFNGDGKTDVAVANYASNNVGILLNNGNGTFAPATTYPSGGSIPASVTTGDFNSDGKADLAVANIHSFTIGILLNNGNGSFAPAASYSSGGNSPSNITTADFNGDGKTDVALTNENSNTVGILLNNGNGSFAPAMTYPSGSNFPDGITTGDFNGDGKTDVVVGNTDPSYIGILLNNGNGSFAPVVTYGSGGRNPRSVATGDFNGDGKADVAVANYASNNIGILLNTCGSVPPSLTNAQPFNSGTEGQQIKVSAFTFSASPNPVANRTRIQYSIPVDAQVNIKVYDVLGREVNTLFSGQRSAGTYSQEYNTGKLSQGVYYCRLLATAGGQQFNQTFKLVKAE